MLFQRLFLSAILVAASVCNLPDQAMAVTIGGLDATDPPRLVIDAVTSTFDPGAPPAFPASLFSVGNSVQGLFTATPGTATVPLADLAFSADFFDFGPPDGPLGSFSVSDPGGTLLSGIFTAQSFSAGILTTAVELDPGLSSAVSLAYSNGLAVLVFSGLNGVAGAGTVDIFGAGAVSNIPLPTGLALLLTGLGGLALISGVRRRGTALNA